MNVFMSLKRTFVFCLVTLSFLVVRCSARQDLFYTVKRGDTLSGIAGMYGVSAKQLQRDNYIIDPRKLSQGTVLKIPVNATKNPSQNGVNDISVKTTPKTLALGNSSQKVKLGNAKQYIGNLFRPLGTKGRITSPYGKRGSKFHKGIDYAAPVGTPIYAAHAGKVVLSGRPFSGYGNVVAIQGDRFLTFYAHTNKNFVRQGQVVPRGYKIAEVGATGRATGPHLHFETRLPTEKGYNIVIDPAIFY